MYFLSVVLVAVLIPVFIKLYLKLNNKSAPYSDIVLYGISFIYFISYFIPSPLIHGENTNFGTHFVAGISAGLIGLYLANIYDNFKIM